MQEHLLDTWRIHARINRFILDAVEPEALDIKPAKGRNVGQMFAHIHNVRLMWLKSAAPALVDELSKIENDDNLEKDRLNSSLSASAEAIETMLADALAEGGKVKGFKPHPPAFIGYLISHEAYHHGEIGMVLAEIGHPLSKKTSFGLWEWGVR